MKYERRSAVTKFPRRRDRRVSKCAEVRRTSFFFKTMAKNVSVVLVFKSLEKLFIDVKRA